MSFNLRIDIDPVIICPYDNNHKIARSRIQRHLVKCEKNFPPDYKQTCPYDATHRIFEHEMKDHVAICPMKFANFAADTAPNIGRLPEIEPEVETKMENDEIWDESTNIASSSNPFNEPVFETVNVKQYTSFTSIRGNVLMTKRYNAKLRRPFGYSQSMMLDISNHSIDEDSQSVTSDMGVGRGQGFLNALRGQHIGGVSRVYRRGFRGRSLH